MSRVPTEDTQVADPKKRAALKKYSKALLGTGAVILTAEQAVKAANAYAGGNPNSGCSGPNPPAKCR